MKIIKKQTVYAFESRKSKQAVCDYLNQRGFQYTRRFGGEFVNSESGEREGEFIYPGSCDADLRLQLVVRGETKLDRVFEEFYRMERDGGRKNEKQ
jgi:hypothetical protein